MKLNPGILSIIASALAIPSFLFALRNYFVSRPKIEIQQLLKTHSSIVIEPEFDLNTPDVYSDRRYRLLIEIIIKNKSSNPISLISFDINGLEYNSYSRPEHEYTVITRSRIITKNGITMTRGNAENIHFPIDDDFINPVTTLQPFESIQGYLFWPLFENDLSKLNIGKKNKLIINTTFKKFKFKIKIQDIIKRDPDLPPSEDWTKESSLS